MSQKTEDSPRLWGLLAEFQTPKQLFHAAESVRDAGYTSWDCHTPFPVHGMDKAMGLKDTRIPWLVFGAGMTGTMAAMAMQNWMNAVDYKFLVSGKPYASIPAQIPIAFELTVLFAALTAFACVFVFNDLPKFFHPVFRSEKFRRVTDDRFFITIEASDLYFDVEKTEQLLREAGSMNVEWLEA